MSASSPVPFFELNNAVVQRAGHAILSVDSFSLAEGESMALIGPNGSGKSTFVNLITREIAPLYRENPPVLFRGNAHATLDEIKRSLGVVSSSMQNQITVHLPAVEVVIGGFFGALGIPRRFEVSQSQRQQAYRVMDELGIAELADRDIMTLSTGQARRVLIARSLVHNPDALIFDEPCTGLDPEGMYYVRRTMRELVRNGRALILVTHYPEDIIPEIDRIITIKNGVVFGDGSKEETLTSSRMSDLFGVPLTVTQSQGYYLLSSAY